MILLVKYDNNIIKAMITGSNAENVYKYGSDVSCNLKTENA